MEIPLWVNPSNDVEVLDASEDEQDKYGHYYGSNTIVISLEHIQALQAGKMLAWNDREYSTFLVLAPAQAGIQETDNTHD